MSRFVKANEDIRILFYCGSVKRSNAAELMSVANVDGALVGGANLKADEFLGIAGSTVSALVSPGGRVEMDAWYASCRDRCKFL